MILIILVLLLVKNGLGDVCQNSLARTCDKCMSVHVDCVWITTKAIAENQPRCTLRSNVSAGVETIRGGKSSVVVVNDEDFRLPSDGTEPAIQIRPQKIKLKLRTNEVLKFKLRYKALADYPLDIYYLVDQTYSMSKHLKELSSLAKTLRTDLGTLTNNSKLAFGYFSDKVAMPYYSMIPGRLEDPCSAVDDAPQCVPGANFVHAVNFTEDARSFSEQIKHFNFTANLDDPEGALDAIMQILLCDAFGWRMHSRKMIVLATDGLLHTAGEGLLGGVVPRAPTECRMRRAGDGRLVYDGMENDYPSVEEVYRQLREKKTSVLFAIQQKEDTTNYYKQMNALLHEVSFLSLMRTDTNNNVMKVLEAGFRDAVKKVQFKVVDSPSYLQLDAEALCHGERNQSWACWNLELDNEYTFEVSVKLLDVPLHKRDVIRIEEMNLHEFVEIEVEYPEICHCTDEVNTVEDKAIHGIFKCGIYICEPMWVGERCDQKCNPALQRYGNVSSRTCSDHGDFDMASCRCVCDHGYDGRVCEVKCGVDKRGEVCSNHGNCGPSGCQCFAGYTGDNCDCSSATDACVQPGTHAVCNRHGTCRCGECICEAENGKNYIGKFCELCPDCENCKYDTNVLDHIRGQLAPEKRDRFVFWGTTTLDPELHNCRVYYTPNSTHSCTVIYASTHSTPIRIEYYQNCVDTQYMYYTAGFGIVGLVIGILFVPLLTWRLCVYFKDKRECSKFEERQKHTLFHPNPHYKDPIRKYENPLKND